MFNSAYPNEFVLCFALLYMVGDVVKLVFLKIEDEFEVEFLNRQRLYGLTFFTLFFYFALAGVTIYSFDQDYVMA
jgi:hypothetical protein